MPQTSGSTSNRVMALAAGAGALLIVLAVTTSIMRRDSSAPTPEPAPPALLEESAASPSRYTRVSVAGEVVPTAVDEAPSGSEKEQDRFPAIPDPDEIPEGELAAEEYVEFRGSQILATVNGAAIRGKDLTPVTQTQMTQGLSMSHEMYAFLLNQGIEREITFQLAKEANIELSQTGLDRLEHIRVSRTHDDHVVDPLGDQAAIIEYEVRQAEARLLERGLMERNGIRNPHVSEEDVEDYYAAHSDEYAALPEDDGEFQAAWTVIAQEIRTTLSPAILLEYQRDRDHFFEESLDNAEVAVLLSPASL